MAKVAVDWLPNPRIPHPWPSVSLRRQTPEVGLPTDGQGERGRRGGNPAGQLYLTSIKYGDGTRVPKLGSLGSVRGARGNARLATLRSEAIDCEVEVGQLRRCSVNVTNATPPDAHAVQIGTRSIGQCQMRAISGEFDRLAV
jgi:hypothetical protein